MISAAVNQYNQLPFNANLRQPRAIVTVNDIPVVWEDIEVQTTTFFMADNYRVVLPLYGQNPTLNLNYWSSVTQITVKIYIGLPLNPTSYNTSDLTPFMVGFVDMMNVDPLTARVTLSGRDLTSVFIDTKTTQVYPNMTASGIATMIAEQQGLTPIVQATSGNVGRFFKNFTTNAQTLVTKQITQWDLLTFLAQQSGFVVYVQANNLFFQPFPTNQSASYILTFQPPQFPGGSPTFHGMDLKFQRSLTLANDVIVNVIVPASPQTGKGFTKQAKYSRRARGLVNLPPLPGTKQSFNFIIAGLTPEQAQNQANTLAKNITLQEIVVSGSVPGDNSLIKGTLVQIKGTNSAYDQVYYLDLVTRRITFGGGYDMDFVIKNVSSDSTIEL